MVRYLLLSDVDDEVLFGPEFADQLLGCHHADVSFLGLDFLALFHVQKFRNYRRGRRRNILST